jgi:hypothetical protein
MFESSHPDFIRHSSDTNRDRSYGEFCIRRLGFKSRYGGKKVREFYRATKEGWVALSMKALYVFGLVVQRPANAGRG